MPYTVSMCRTPLSSPLPLTHQIMDDLGIMAAPAASDAKKRVPPRRAVTWVNEVRWASLWVNLCLILVGTGACRWGRRAAPSTWVNEVRWVTGRSGQAVCSGRV